MKLITIFSLICCFCISSISAQKKSCDDPVPDWPNVLTAKQVNTFMSNNNHADPSFNIRVKFHVLRETNGTTGPNASDINTQVGYLNTYFASLNTSFTLDPINYIDNSDYVDNAYVDANGGYVSFCQSVLYPAHGATSRLDIFVWPFEFGFLAGNAIAIPNDYMAVSEVKFSTYWDAHISHEAGHCLNLLHTHQSANLPCPNALKEDVDGGNCATAGDYCCDTPADPKLNNGASTFNTTTCTYVSGPVDCDGTNYAPDGSNIMSYGDRCRNNFSNDQANRMIAELSFGAKGPSMLVCNNSITVSGTVEDGLYSANVDVTNDGVVNSGGTVKYSAGTSIKFSPGTKLLSGCSVEAKLNGCAGN